VSFAFQQRKQSKSRSEKNTRKTGDQKVRSESERWGGSYFPPLANETTQNPNATKDVNTETENQSGWKKKKRKTVNPLMGNKALFFFF